RLYFWDEVFGEVIWEFPLENPASQDLVRGFLNGRLVIENDTRPGGGLHYFHRDHLGSSKLMTDFFSPTVVCDEVYHPFGQVQSEQPSGCNAHVRKFTEKERDPESGLDYFGARYCDSITGRFLSVDPALGSADPGAPQTWNRYAYVINNPMIFIDPDGRDLQFSGTDDQQRELEQLAAAGLPCNCRTRHRRGWPRIAPAHRRPGPRDSRAASAGRNLERSHQQPRHCFNRPNQQFIRSAHRLIRARSHRLGRSLKICGWPGHERGWIAGT
ncbi:MAG: RHS repeat-associated core domain-containing protein, partial [Acidobacteriota bacterium]